MPYEDNSLGTYEVLKKNKTETPFTKAEINSELNVLGVAYWPKNWIATTNLASSNNGHPIYQPLRSAGYDTRSIFKRSLTGLNSEFSFS